LAILEGKQAAAKRRILALSGRRRWTKSLALIPSAPCHSGRGCRQGRLADRSSRVIQHLPALAIGTGAIAAVWPLVAAQAPPHQFREPVPAGARLAVSALEPSSTSTSSKASPHLAARTAQIADPVATPHFVLLFCSVVQGMDHRGARVWLFGFAHGVWQVWGLPKTYGEAAGLRPPAQEGVVLPSWAAHTRRRLRAVRCGSGWPTGIGGTVGGKLDPPPARLGGHACGS